MNPLYPTKNYKQFVKQQKQKGLLKRYWKDLPEMWKEELLFRKELEECLK